MVAAWAWAVVADGRALPWQADRVWLAAFGAALLVHVAWFWGFEREVARMPVGAGRRIAAVAWGWAPLLAASIGFLLPVYFSDTVNSMIEMHAWRPLAGAALALLAAACLPMREAALVWLEGRAAARDGLVEALSRRAGVAAICSLAIVGAMQASSIVMPIGDDMSRYTAAAEAMLAGQPYPVDVVVGKYESAGMSSAYPALPLFPTLLALSFAALGHTLAATMVPIVAATALFPLALFAALRSITGARAVSYGAALILTLLPIYRIHALGPPEPDAVFVVLLLLAAAAAGKAHPGFRVSGSRFREGDALPLPPGDPARAGSAEARSGTAGGRVEGRARTSDTRNAKPIWWAAFGLAVGLAALTRPEGMPYAGILLALFGLAWWRDRRYWLAVASFVVPLLPFAFICYSVSGSIWPGTYGGSVLSLANLSSNAQTLGWAAVPWYAQTVGLPVWGFLALLFGACLAAVAGTALLWRERGAIAAIPLAGLANLGAGFLVHPVVLEPFAPTNALRHLSYGIPYAWIGLAFAAVAAFRLAGRSRRWRARAAGMGLLLCLATVAIESHGLARPEPYLGGRTSLLWTADAITLADLASTPLEFPRAGEWVSWEAKRLELSRPFERTSLRIANRSEPYQWLSLLAAVLGMLPVAAAAISKGGAPRRNSLS